jgi:catechol 2,3-dioxygenase-like lactoylglutathione lyase family enzyme
MPSFSIGGLDHVVLRVRDVDRMVTFYRDVLGCTVEKVQKDFGLTQLRAGDSLIDLVDVEGPLGRKGGPAPGADARNLDHFCLRVAPWNADAIRAGLAAAGVEVGEEGRRYGAQGYGPSLYLSDPEGNVVELKGPPD